MSPGCAVTARIPFRNLMVPCMRAICAPPYSGSLTLVTLWIEGARVVASKEALRLPRPAQAVGAASTAPGSVERRGLRMWEKGISPAVLRRE